jgi:prepilin-type processing-associated H-X9-DG protein
VGVAGILGQMASPWYGFSPGILTDRSQVSLAQVTALDGTSQTLLFGEALGDSPKGTTNFTYAWMGCGSLPTAWGLQDDNGTGWYNFGSRHTSVVNFCWGDGSVRGCRKGGAWPWFSGNQSDSWYSFNYAAGWSDAHPFNADAFSN